MLPTWMRGALASCVMLSACMPLGDLITVDDAGPADGEEDASLDPDGDELDQRDAEADGGLGDQDASAAAPVVVDGAFVDASSTPDAALTDAAYVDAPPADAAAGLPEPWEGTLINQLGSSAADFVGEPHMLWLVSAEGPEPSSSYLFPTTSAVGHFSLQPPDRRNYWVHVAGRGPASASESTYDTLTLWAPQSGDTFARVGHVGTAALSETTGDFSASPDHVAIQGTVYRVDPTGKRVGTIGCAKIYLDNLVSPAVDAAQRYNRGVLPSLLSTADRTERSGKWFFGNVAPGLHTFRVSVDDGQTFVATKTVHIPFARKDARGDAKTMLVFMGIDVPGTDRTPVSCPADI